MGGPIPDFGWGKLLDGSYDPIADLVEKLLQWIKDNLGIDLFWLLDWSWLTNTITELLNQVNDFFAWLLNPIQRPPNLLWRPGFSSPLAIADAPDWSWDAVISLGTVTGPNGNLVTDPQGSARTTADGAQHSMLSNPIVDKTALGADQILTCQIHVLAGPGFTAADDMAIRMEIVPSLHGVAQTPVLLANCGVPVDDPVDWIAAPVGSKQIFFDADYQLPTEDVPDKVELRLVVSGSAGGGVDVRFDGARVAAAGGWIIVLADLFEAGRLYLTDLWVAIVEHWLPNIGDSAAWSVLATETDAAWVRFVQRVKRALRHGDAASYVPPSTSDIIRSVLLENPVFGWLFKIGFAVTDWVGELWTAVMRWIFGVAVGSPYYDPAFVGSDDDRKPFSSALWAAIITVCVDGFDTMVIKILEAVGFTAPDDGADRSLSNIIKSMLTENPTVGWLFKIWFAVIDWVSECWDALADWMLGDPGFPGSADDRKPFSSVLWTSMGVRWSTAWDTMIAAVNDAIAGEVRIIKNLNDMIRDALLENPVFGWLFKIGYAVTDYLTETFDAIADWAFGGFTTALWNSMQTRMNAAWTVMTDAIGDALDKTFTRNKSPNDLISDALKGNPWFGWLFTMVDSWLQPVLTVGKAVTDFGDAVWHAITVFAANAASPTAWSTLTSAITNAWNTMVDAILDAWGSNKTHADFANPASATEAALKNNPVTGWLWGNSFDGGNWLNDSIHAITDPINSFFDSVRRFINQMVQPLHWGYFDSNWAWKASTSTPLTALPGGGGQLLTPGVSSDSGGMSWQADSTIPPAPTGVSAIPWWDLSVSGFPAGNVTYGISAVKGGKEGPAALVSVFVGTLSPPNVNGRVDLSWSAVSGADSYRVYRQVDATYSTTDWRLVASPLQAYSLLSPLSDKAARSGGTVAHPKTDAELSGQIVTALNTKTQNLTSSGTLATSSLTGNLDSGRVDVPGWTSLTEFAASTFGQWALTSNPGSISTATVAGTYRLPTTLLNAMSFNGRDVVQSGQGGMKFTRQGWYTFIISFQMLSTTSQYAIGAVLLNSGGSIFLEGASFINPAFSTGFNPTVQCVGLVNIDSSQVGVTFYPGYTITGTTDAKFNTSSGKSATYISATFIK